MADKTAADYQRELDACEPPADGLWYRPGEDGCRLCTLLRLAQFREQKTGSASHV